MQFKKTLWAEEFTGHDYDCHIQERRMQERKGLNILSIKGKDSLPFSKLKQEHALRLNYHV